MAELSIAQEVVRGVATAASVVIGAKFALRTYRSNQWWDARHKTYEKGVAILDELAHAASSYIREWHQDKASFGSFEEGFLKDEEPAATRFRNASMALASLTSQGRFNMSNDALAILVSLCVEIRKIKEEKFSTSDELVFLRDAVQCAIPEFSLAAQADLQVLSISTQVQRRVVPLIRWLKNRLQRALIPLVHPAYVIWYGKAKGEKLAKERIARILISF